MAYNGDSFTSISVLNKQLQLCHFTVGKLNLYQDNLELEPEETYVESHGVNIEMHAAPCLFRSQFNDTCDTKLPLTKKFWPSLQLIPKVIMLPNLFERDRMALHVARVLEELGDTLDHQYLSISINDCDQNLNSIVDKLMNVTPNYEVIHQAVAKEIHEVWQYLLCDFNLAAMKLLIDNILQYLLMVEVKSLHMILQLIVILLRCQLKLVSRFYFLQLQSNVLQLLYLDKSGTNSIVSFWESNFIVCGDSKVKGNQLDVINCDAQLYCRCQSCHRKEYFTLIWNKKRLRQREVRVHNHFY